MTLKDKRLEWKTQYDAWKDSDQSIAEWCRNHGLKPHQMYYWVQQFEEGPDAPKNEPGQTQWLTVQMDNEIVASEGQGPIYIHLGAISVEVQPDADRDLLSDIVSLLNSQC
ncbi:transposase [Lentibacillus cibarius]|uniref:Transposase n=1 Tax=Lentibacillus cibarius TaxID=2583219 RepID=A0A549YHW7_9BACI|nr:transposase [Lentibacillus cibarius]TRM11475.1 transposase [Lentibacillus cibarius]